MRLAKNGDRAKLVILLISAASALDLGSIWEAATSRLS
jgi:hypothetical protein